MKETQFLCKEMDDLKNELLRETLIRQEWDRWPNPWRAAKPVKQGLAGMEYMLQEKTGLWDRDYNEKKWKHKRSLKSKVVKPGISRMNLQSWLSIAKTTPWATWILSHSSQVTKTQPRKMKILFYESKQKYKTEFKPGKRT